MGSVSLAALAIFAACLAQSPEARTCQVKPAESLTAVVPGYIYAEPNEKSKILGSFRKTQIVKPQKTVNPDWYQVIVTNGTTGFVRTKEFRAATDVDIETAYAKPVYPKEAEPWILTVASTKNSEPLDPSVCHRIVAYGPACIPAIAYELRTKSPEGLPPVKMHLAKLLAQFGVDAVDTIKMLITDGNGLERDAGTLVLCLQLARLEENAQIGKTNEAYEILRARLNKKDIEDLLLAETKDLAGLVPRNALLALSLLRNTKAYPLLRANFSVNPGRDGITMFARVAHPDDVDFIWKRFLTTPSREKQLKAVSLTVEGLGEVRSSVSHEVLRRMLGDKNPIVRSKAAFSISKFNDPSDLPRLTKMFDDPEVVVATFALLAAFHLGDETQMDMIKIISEAKIPLYRAWLAMALVNKLGNPHTEMIDKLAIDKDESVRLALALTLSKTVSATVDATLKRLELDGSLAVKYAAREAIDRRAELNSGS